MQARWGNYPMPVNGAKVTSALTVAQATEYGAPLRYAVAYTVELTLLGDGAPDLSKKELAFRRAMEVQNLDFGLFDDDGKLTSAAILAGETASGTRVVSIGTPDATGGEFVNRRTMTLVITAEYHVADSAKAVVSWQESLTITGNGKPRRSWRFPVGPPGAKGVRQVITPYSLVRAVQAGRGVGYGARPDAPKYLFPNYLVNESETYGFDAPQLMGLGYDPVNYGISWSYSYERGDGQLVGFPRLPPGVI